MKILKLGSFILAWGTILVHVSPSQSYNILSSAVCGLRVLKVAGSGACDAASSFNDRPPKSASKSISSWLMVCCFVAESLSVENPASNVSNTSRESGPVSMVEVCLRLEPFGLRDEDRRDEEESLETRDSEEPRGETPPRWDVTYGLKELEVLRGSGEYALFPGWGVEGPGLLAGPPASRSSHMATEERRR
jgi:hypothetical protein